MAEVSGLPKQVVIALAHTMSHLASFGLSEVFCDARFFVKFSTQTHMLLGANTLSNLEIYENQTDFSSKGSLISILDRTKTKFGARMLKTWVGRPLTNKLYVLFPCVNLSEWYVVEHFKNASTLWKKFWRVAPTNSPLCGRY